MFARNFATPVEGTVGFEAKPPSATIAICNAAQKFLSIESVKPSEKRRFPHPATSITSAKPVRLSYIPPRGAGMITAAGSLNADPVMSTT